MDNIKPTDKQRKFLLWKKVPESEIAKMTFSEASARIDSLKTAENKAPELPTKYIYKSGELIEKPDLSELDKIFKHIDESPIYEKLSEGGKLEVFRVATNYLQKIYSTDKIDEQKRAEMEKRYSLYKKAS